MPFHFPSDVISPNSGLAFMYGPGLADFGSWFGGLNATCGWLFVLVSVALDETELEVSNEVAGDLTGDLGCPGRFFCNLVLSSLVGDFCAGLLLLPGLLYLSWLVRTVSCGGSPPIGPPAWSNLFAIFFTVPAGRFASTGVDFTEFNMWFAEFGGPEAALACFRMGERDMALVASVGGCNRAAGAKLSVWGVGVGGSR